VEFEIVGEIGSIERIAVKTSIRDLSRLRKMYGKARWRKLKGIARIPYPTLQREAAHRRIALVRSPWYRQKRNSMETLPRLKR
jgi:hypothetical protein